jgi:cell wall-associated NlpC family hydrolase
MLVAAGAVLVPTVLTVQATDAATGTTAGTTTPSSTPTATPPGTPTALPTALPTGTNTAAVTEAKKQSSWSRRHEVGLKAVAAARKQIGKPYRYGGDGPSSFDCSGLVQYVYDKAGVRLPRTADAQHSHVKRHVKLADVATGDLVYFYGDGHTGIVSKVKGSKVYMIHAAHTGTRIKQVLVNSYYRQNFNGAVRPY